MVIVTSEPDPRTILSVSSFIIVINVDSLVANSPTLGMIFLCLELNRIIVPLDLTEKGNSIRTDSIPFSTGLKDGYSNLKEESIFPLVSDLVVLSADNVVGSSGSIPRLVLSTPNDDDGGDFPSLEDSNLVLLDSMPFSTFRVLDSKAYLLGLFTYFISIQEE